MTVEKSRKVCAFPWVSSHVFVHKLLLTHLCHMDSSTFTLRTGPFPKEDVSGKFLLFSCFIETPHFNANSVDPD